MNLKTTRVSIKGGKIELEAEGFSGPSCQQATEPYRQSLGLGEAEQQETLKREYYDVVIVSDLWQGSE